MEIKDLEITRGDTWDRTVYFSNDDGMLDITGWTVFFTVKEKITDLDTSAKIAKTITTHVDPTHGETEISLTSTDTNLIGNFIYDIQVKTETGSVLTIVTGTITFLEDVTLRTS